jgi:hypothetical protein
MIYRDLHVLTRPLVQKMAGQWMWVCSHGGALVGDSLGPGDSRDPWAAVVALARKHAAGYHNDDPGEEIPPCP